MSMIVTMTNAPTRTRWLIVALLFGIYMLMVIDRVSISIAAKYMMPEYQLSEGRFYVLGEACTCI